MPESVSDRPTIDHEHIFMFSKSPKYYYDQGVIRVPVTESSIKRAGQNIAAQKGSDRIPGKTNGPMKCAMPKFGGNKYPGHDDRLFRTKSARAYKASPMRNKRTVWTVAPSGFKEAHFAVYPEKLIKDCILAGTPPNGIVLDPFHGSGTTGICATRNGRNYLGFELNPDYIEIENKRRLKEFPHENYPCIPF